jgi:hypothetical protein
MFRADQGWIDVMDVDASTNARLSTTPDGVVYRFVNAARPTEFFLWSNLENQQEWVSIDGSGLLVWHYDDDIGGNNPPDPLQLAVVQAGGKRQLSATTWPEPGSAATDLFAKGANSELAAETQPNTHWNDGSPSGLRIYDISSPGMTMEFSVGTGPVPAGGSGAATAGAGGASGGQAGSDSSGGGVGGNSGGSAMGGSASDAAGNGGTTTGGGPSPGLAGTGGSVAGSGATTAPPVTTATDGSCSCRVGARTPYADAMLLGLVGAIGVLAQRRRRQRAANGGPQCPKMSSS